MGSVPVHPRAAGAALSGLTDHATLCVLVRIGGEEFALMELEPIEPSLYLRTDEVAAERFAHTINRRFLTRAECARPGRASCPGNDNPRRGRRRRGLQSTGFSRWAYEPAIWLLTVVKVALALEPSAVMATRQTTMISASMTAYSTAVGPSSARKKFTADAAALDNIVIPLRCSMRR